MVPFCTGYAVGAGHFLSPNSTEIIGGAPQQEQTGKVRIFFFSMGAKISVSKTECMVSHGTSDRAVEGSMTGSVYKD